jgi:hypothetical protein
MVAANGLLRRLTERRRASTADGCFWKLRMPVSRRASFRRLLDQKLSVTPSGSKAREDVSLVRDHQQSTFELARFGRSFLSRRNLDPLSAFVSALQLVVFRSTGQIPWIRQLMTMSFYRYMDLASAVVTTREMVRFLHAMEEPGTTLQQRREYLQAAINSQIALCRTARRHVSVFRLAHHCWPKAKDEYVVFISTQS